VSLWGGLEKTTRNLIQVSLCIGQVLKKVVLKYKSEVSPSDSTCSFLVVIEEFRRNLML